MVTRLKDWLPAVARGAVIECELTAGESLFRLGDKTIGLCEVVEGRVRLTRVDRSGQEIVLHVAGPGETFAEASLFSPAYHCDAVANTRAVVRVYPKTAMLETFARDPKAAQAFAATLAHQVMTLRARIEQRNIRSAPARVRHYLALNVGDDGRTIVLRGTLKDMAAELGLTHEAFYRTLKVLEKAGEIRRTKSKIILLRRI